MAARELSEHIPAVAHEATEQQRRGLVDTLRHVFGRLDRELELAGVVDRTHQEPGYRWAHPCEPDGEAVRRNEELRAARRERLRQQRDRERGLDLGG